MSRLAIYLTLPGFGGGSRPAPPPPPAAPPPAPTPSAPVMVQGGGVTTPAATPAVRQAVDASRRQQSMRQGIGGSVRNIGGARGISVTETARALKSLTGQ